MDMTKKFDPDGRRPGVNGDSSGESTALRVVDRLDPEETVADPSATTMKASPVDDEATCPYPDLADMQPRSELPSTQPPIDPHRTQRSGVKVGPYVIVERLGRGSQGDVWRAFRLEPYFRSVALKILWQALAVDSDRVDRLRKEAERGGRLCHPALLPILDFDHADGVAFIAMPVVEGFTLAGVIDQRRSRRDGSPPTDLHRLAILPEVDYFAVMARLLGRVARGLASAHDAQIVHRDVKPSNILLDRSADDGIYLSDFGLARDLEDVTDVSGRGAAGTLPYMAPEKLLLRLPWDEMRADVYSFGVTLCEALTLGRPVAWPKDLAPARIASHLASAVPRRPRSIEPKLPRDLDAIVRMATDPDAARRYPSATELADDLDRFLAGEPVLARPAGPFRRMLRRLRTYKKALVAIGAVLLVALTLAASLAVSRRISASRAAFARAEAEAKLTEGRPEEAYEATLLALEHDPENSATLDLVDRCSLAMLENYNNALSFDNVLPAWRIDRRWREMTAGRGLSRAQEVRDLSYSSISLRSDRPSTRLTLHSLRADATPIAGSPLYTKMVDLTQEDLRQVIPGAYWATATAPGGAFCEQPIFVPRGRIGSPMKLDLTLHPRSNRESAADMIRVPGGRFRMDSAFVKTDAATMEGGANAFAVPPPRPPAGHSSPDVVVSVDPFWLDSHEVTNAEFRAFLAEAGLLDARTLVWGRSGEPKADRLDWPVTGVRFDQASAYAAWRGCRLPTEEELEWAARRETGRVRPPGVAADWQPAGPSWLELHPVASEPLDAIESDGKTIFGLFGNAAELTLYHGRADLSRTSLEMFRLQCYVIRCGTIHSTGGYPVSLGYTGKGMQPPGQTHAYVGFRCARSERPKFPDSATLATKDRP